MAVSQEAHTARTRVVLSRNRASTRAATEPVVDIEPHPTEPLHRLARGTDPSPYVDVEISVGREGAPELEPFDIPTNPFARASSEDLAQSTLEVERVLDSLAEPKQAAKQLRLTWLGVVLTPPEVGASLVIGTWLRKDFCVTSPVARVAQKHQGVLVQTANNRYFVKHGGDTYLVDDRD